MGDKFNFFIDSLISVFLRFLELPFFVVFFGLVCASALFYLIFKLIFKNRFSFKFYRRAGALVLIVLCLILFDKKISLLQNEINVVNEKVENVSMNSSQASVSNSIEFDTKSITSVFPGASVFEKPLNEAMTLVSFKKDNPLGRVYVAIVDLTHPRIELKMNEAIDKKTLTSSFGKEYKCEVAINGEAGETPEPGAILGEWTGNYIVKGKPILQEDGELRPFLSFNRNNKGTYFEAKLIDTANNPERYNTIWGRFDVLVNNEVVPDQQQRSYTRTVMGIDEAGKTLYLMIADGKRPSYSMGLTYEECGKVMKSLGAKNAMACDQGGSTAMYVKAVNGLINRPADSDGQERPIYTHFGISLF
jgi:exopolysaccharide biosynthesis protein